MSTAEGYNRFFEVKLELFDGPLDLLLHLVKKRELPIEKVSLAEVTGQYLECIKGLRYYDVETAAEYLVIAATMLSVKASVLLNDPLELIPDENGDLIDPHEALVNRLKELEAFRAAASDLGGRPVLGQDVFAAPVKAKKIDPALIPIADHQSELLARAFHAVMSRLGERTATYSITIDPVSVVERMRVVVDCLKNLGGVGTFAALIGEKADRATAIGVFVAVLELCRRRMIAVSQDGPKAEIKVSLADNNDGPTVDTAEELAEVAA